MNARTDQEFEARKLVDLQGEALVGQEESLEVCRSMNLGFTGLGSVGFRGLGFRVQGV